MSAPTTLELLWGGSPRPKRGPKPSLSLERIVTEAIALADADGLASLSMQRLAERLGCAKMALYRYIPGKAELTALMLDAALGPAPTPPVQGDRPEQGGAGNGAEAYWRVALRAWAVAVFEQMCAHPWALEVAVGVRPLGPCEVGWFEAGLEPLGDSGLSGAERLDALALLSGHARSLAQQARSAGGEELEDGMTRQLGETLAAHADRYPATIAAFAESDAPGDRNNALHFGIDRILDGLGVLISRHRSDSVPQKPDA
ncbi:TetR/AcrR family transcriptional regulator C-terminal domain-containing protein [Nocardia terpenica]|uniref:TetR/AcrR family transcriptional regulator n=1 Tax=Nocardia terpenica TaxID=455432 RepID=UPI001894FC56|nr:TetR/AcrR family transcriptional regulator [Nocardia terpenica]MBF6060762.1 TetR/AcrR family transcriptional regulator C-terminal domain-containing protein [Nocardia terpenica]MBF6104022.1 TetR/AcrR family transcriptional regulator C-terminal domain-containing protein [Nocardia terpenica]MBF6111604.1 TetR/AcrR family transcriptional regulator C-terminal domain-containing protein [Nocardia terpenica]MBF6118243.1 TetR/AcrR family transcriptional regulator C-terminal domain-containing protein [